MKRNLILITFFLLTAYTNVKAQTYSLNIDSLAKIDFPAKPKLMQTNAGKLYTIDKDSRVYMVLIQDIRTNKLTYLASADLPVFYEGIIKGTLQQAKGVLRQKQQAEIDGLQGLDFEYVSSQYADSTTSEFLPEYRFHRDLLLNGRLINCIYWTTSDSLQTRRDTVLRNAFFNSFKVTIAESKRSQYPDLGFGEKYNNDSTLIFITLAVVLGAMILLIGILYLVQRYKRKKRNNSNNG